MHNIQPATDDAESPAIATPNRQMPRIFYWVGITVSVDFNSGIQRVARCLGRELQNFGYELIPVKGTAGGVHPLSRRETKFLEKWGGPSAKARFTLPEPRDGDILLIPELVSPLLPENEGPIGWARKRGMKVAAIFYDMIPLLHRENYPEHIVAPLIEFWKHLAGADIVLPISKTVAKDFLQFKTYHGLFHTGVDTILLPGEIPGTPRCKTARTHPGKEPFRLIAVGSWEPRKNYPRILRAVLDARDQGENIHLTIVGRDCGHTHPELNAEIFRLAEQIGEDSVSLNFFLEDEVLRTMVEASHATVFGSWLEGFGLPVLESIWNGLPCICHNGSSIGEIAPGGGTIMVDMLEEREITSAIISLSSDEARYSELVNEALKRRVKTWTGYGIDVFQALTRIGQSPHHYETFGRM